MKYFAQTLFDAVSFSTANASQTSDPFDVSEAVTVWLQCSATGTDSTTDLSIQLQVSNDRLSLPAAQSTWINQDTAVTFNTTNLFMKSNLGALKARVAVTRNSGAAVLTVRQVAKPSYIYNPQPSTTFVSVGDFGSTANSAGASLAAGVYTLQPASATQPGGVSTGTQTLAGTKSFSGSVRILTTIPTIATAADRLEGLTVYNTAVHGDEALTHIIGGIVTLELPSAFTGATGGFGHRAGFWCRLLATATSADRTYTSTGPNYAMIAQVRFNVTGGRTFTDTAALWAAIDVAAPSNDNTGTIALTDYAGIYFPASTYNTGTNKYHLLLENISGATNNYAIKTGLGLVQFGDACTLGAAGTTVHTINGKYNAVSTTSQAVNIDGQAGAVYLRLRSTNTATTYVQGLSFVSNAGETYTVGVSTAGTFSIANSATVGTTIRFSIDTSAKCTISGAVAAAGIKSGANQTAAGALANELWVDTSAAYVVKRGV